MSTFTRRRLVLSYIILNKDALPQDGNSHDFQGFKYGDTNISFIWVDMPPGDGPRLHKHPYQEIFILLEGQATYTVGNSTIEAKANQVVIAPANIPHKFVNSGQGVLKQIDIHLSPRFITEWLED